MMNILSVKSVWERKGIKLTRVRSMQEAVKLTAKEYFEIIGINADNTNYLPQLLMLRDMSAAPIHVVTSHYTVSGYLDALEHGADVYADWRENTDENVARALAILGRIHLQQKKRSERLCPSRIN